MHQPAHTNPTTHTHTHTHLHQPRGTETGEDEDVRQRVAPAVCEREIESAVQVFVSE